MTIIQPPTVPKKLPFLESICWQTKNVYHFTPEEMLSRYERGWKYCNLFNNLEGEELTFLKQLAKYYQSWLQVSLSMTFRLEHHNKIITVLECLNAEVLLKSSALQEKRLLSKCSTK